MKVLVLEDREERIVKFKARFESVGWHFTFVDKAAYCIQHLQREKFDVVFLDHDLDQRAFVPVHETNTGSEVARWWADNDHINKDTPVFIHSFHRDGAKYMQDQIGHALYRPAVWEADMFDECFFAESHNANDAR